MKALLLVDIQNDFLPGGRLPVDHGERIISVINRMLERFDPVLAIQDWHPPDHQAFASQHPRRQAGEEIFVQGQRQMLWPDHCVQYTGGALFAPGLQTAGIARVFTTGVDPAIDSYSGFFDSGQKRSTGLDQYLAKRGIRSLYLAGLAAESGVLFTALDARRLGLETWVITDAVRGFEVTTGDTQRALAKMVQAGATLTDSGSL